MRNRNSRKLSILRLRCRRRLSANQMEANHRSRKDEQAFLVPLVRRGHSSQTQRPRFLMQM